MLSNRDRAILTSVTSALRSDTAFNIPMLKALERKIVAIEPVPEKLDVLGILKDKGLRLNTKHNEEFQVVISSVKDFSLSSLFGEPEEDYLYWKGERVPAKEFHARIRSEKMEREHERVEASLDNDIEREDDFKDTVVTAAGLGLATLIGGIATYAVNRYLTDKDS